MSFPELPGGYDRHKDALAIVDPGASNPVQRSTRHASRMPSSLSPGQFKEALTRRDINHLLALRQFLFRFPNLHHMKSSGHDLTCPRSASEHYPMRRRFRLTTSGSG